MPELPEWIEHLPGQWRAARLVVADLQTDGVEVEYPATAAFFDSEGLYAFAYPEGCHIIVFCSLTEDIRDAAASAYAETVMNGMPG